MTLSELYNKDKFNLESYIWSILHLFNGFSFFFMKSSSKNNPRNHKTKTNFQKTYN